MSPDPPWRHENRSAVRGAGPPSDPAVTQAVVVVQKGAQRTLELTAVNGEILAKEQRTGLRFQTKELVLGRGDTVTFKASVLLAARPMVVPVEQPATLGTLVIENRHARARVQVTVVGAADGLEMLQQTTKAGLKALSNGPREARPRKS